MEDEDDDANLEILQSDAGVFASSCGHAMHTACFARFSEGQRFARLNGKVTGLCPLCQTAFNSTIPILPIQSAAVSSTSSMQADVQQNAIPFHGLCELQRALKAVVNNQVTSTPQQSARMDTSEENGADGWS